MRSAERRLLGGTIQDAGGRDRPWCCNARRRTWVGSDRLGGDARRHDADRERRGSDGTGCVGHGHRDRRTADAHRRAGDPDRSSANRQAGREADGRSRSATLHRPSRSRKLWRADLHAWRQGRRSMPGFVTVIELPARKMGFAMLRLPLEFDHVACIARPSRRRPRSGTAGSHREHQASLRPPSPFSPVLLSQPRRVSQSALIVSQRTRGPRW